MMKRHGRGSYWWKWTIQDFNCVFQEQSVYGVPYSIALTRQLFLMDPHIRWIVNMVLCHAYDTSQSIDIETWFRITIRRAGMKYDLRLEPLLLTWINFNPSMDEYLSAQ